jgi:hypothetical protein
MVVTTVAVVTKVVMSLAVSGFKRYLTYSVVVMVVVVVVIVVIVVVIVVVVVTTVVVGLAVGIEATIGLYTTSISSSCSMLLLGLAGGAISCSLDSVTS